ncbi:MAG: hypothetical protein NC341_12285 [Blautia sp.]|nr:hypothetical protein [Blautia sp.]MCM1199928.1 hypothetical protein [Bacteroides fragilis]
MAVTGIGNADTTGRIYSVDEDIVIKRYAYKDGRGQETVSHLKDCLQLSVDSYTIPVGSDTYEEIKNRLKKQSPGDMSFPGNQMFYESYAVMKDFYDGRLNRDEVKDIFKEYFYHSIGMISSQNTLQMSAACTKQTATRNLAGLYEYFSRANTRNACAANNREGRELLENSGLNGRGSCYYDADWYWVCEEMQEMFRRTADELADEYGAEHVDFDYVEKNTRFTLDGGITYNGVWNSVKWQQDADRNSAGQYLDAGAPPPRGFLYCSCGLSDSAGDSSQAVTLADRIKKAITETDRNKKYTNLLFLIALDSDADKKQSLLYDKEGRAFSNDEAKEALRQKAMEFLAKFHINYGNGRMEFLRMGERAS